MKALVPMTLAAILLCGCSRSYTLTTNSGGQIVAKGKPRLENGVYRYKDVQGREATVPAGRIREVAPTSMVASPSDTFRGSK